MNETQKANVQRLIKHYVGNPPQGWMFDKCAGGVLQRWGLVDGLLQGSVEPEVAKALGISTEEAHTLVYNGYTGGEGYQGGYDPAYLHIVPSLKKLLETGRFVWARPGPKN